jgi:hypothetical protein
MIAPTVDLFYLLLRALFALFISIPTRGGLVPLATAGRKRLSPLPLPTGLIIWFSVH